MTVVASTQKEPSQQLANGIAFTEALVVWSRVAILSFGGVMVARAASPGVSR